MAVKAKRVIFLRDGRWHWELVVNGVAVARGSEEGYADKGECRSVADRVVAGYYRDADRRIRDRDR